MDTTFPPPGQARNAQFHPPHAEGATRIGCVDDVGQGWEPVMLYTHASAEIQALFVMVDKIASLFANGSRLEGEAWNVAAVAVGAELQAIKAALPKIGGTPSAGFQSRGGR
jgi:hypothetical protein